MTELRTCCRCCPAGCGIVVTVEGRRVTGVRGDRDHPISRGYTCAKGRALPAFHHRPDRLDHPSMRLPPGDAPGTPSTDPDDPDDQDDPAGRPAGRAAEGSIVRRRVSWSAVLDDLAARVRGLVERHGPDSVGVYRATGTSGDTLGRRAAERFVRQLGSTQYYSAATVDVAPAWRAGEMVSGSGRELTPVWVPEHPDSRLVLFVGCNPVVSHGYLTLLSDPIRRIRAFQRRGGRVWVCDPRRTETARLADGHVAARPGTDVVLLAWLVRSLLEEGADRHELARFVDPHDLTRLRAGLEGLDRARVAARCDVAGEDLDRLLAAIRAAGRIAVVAGTGVTFGRHALLTEWLRWVLLVVTGSLDRPGGMWFNPGWMVAVEQRDRWEPAPPEGRVEPGPASRPDLPRLFGQNPCAALVDEIESGRLRALLVAGGSPLTAFPDPDRTAAALRSLEVLAVVDVVATPLTGLATHVLPATGQLERTDLVALERTMLAPAVVAPDPATQRRPTWWIFAQLGHRLDLDALGIPAGVGLGEPSPPAGPTPPGSVHHTDGGGAGPTAPAARSGRIDDGTALAVGAEPELLRALAAQSRDGADALFAAGSHGVASPPLYGWVRDRALPGGRWRIAPPGMLERLGQVLASPGDRQRRESGPLHLVSRRQVGANNATRYVPPERSADRPVVLLHPEDAAGLGVADGDRVELRSEAGSVVAVARPHDGMRRGVVSLPHGWHDANVCRLTDAGAVDPLTTQPQMSGFAVTLHPADAPIARLVGEDASDQQPNDDPPRRRRASDQRPDEDGL